MELPRTSQRVNPMRPGSGGASRSAGLADQHGRVRLREELLGVQYGNRPDPYGWVCKLA